MSRQPINPPITTNFAKLINRDDGRTLGHFGFFSHAGGEFHWLHMVATDSNGNVYTGEVDTGKRVQQQLQLIKKLHEQVKELLSTFP